MFDQRDYGQGVRPDFLGKCTTFGNRNDYLLYYLYMNIGLK